MHVLISSDSLIKEVYKADEASKACCEKVAILEQELQKSALPDETKAEIQKELDELRKLVLVYEESVKMLRLTVKKLFQM